MGEQVGTLPGHRDVDGARRGRALRRIGIVVLVLLVGAGMAGALGPRTGDVSASNGGYRLDVRHAEITRPGLPAPLRITVERPGGFDGPVTLRLDKDFGDHLDFQTWYPTPSAETAGPRLIEYEFDPPPGDVLEITLDARTAPGQPPSSRRYSVAVVDAGREAVATNFRMTVMP